MNNLHRSLAPVSDAAWDQIEDEARRTFIRRAAARRVVDVPEPNGYGLNAVGLGHVKKVDSPADGVTVQQRLVQPVLELRAPFYVTRMDVDDVDRGSQDSNWQPVKDAANEIAMAEDRIVFHGADGIEGIAPASSNPKVALPDDVRDYPAAVAKALNELRLAGVAGPYSLVLPDETYTEVAETTNDGYPVLDHVSRIMGDGHIIWAPGAQQALVITERGGDYTLQLGQDLSVGYLNHDDEKVQLYLQETMTFHVNTTEASVVIG